MKHLPTIAAAAMMAATLAACGSNNKPTADPSAPSSLKVSQATTSTSPPTKASPTKASPPSSPQGKATTLDPCQLVTQGEASSLANASFGPGKQEASGIGKQCVYGAQTPNVLRVIVLEGASTEDAQTEWNQLLAEAKQAAGQAANLIQLTPESGFADRAEWVELNLSSIHVDGRGLALLSGAVGVYIVDLVRDGAAPSRAALTAEAQIVLTRLP
jgi:hypothetical protein